MHFNKTLRRFVSESLKQNKMSLEYQISHWEYFNTDLYMEIVVRRADKLRKTPNRYKNDCPEITTKGQRFVNKIKKIITT